MLPKETFGERIGRVGHRESSWTDAGHSVREQVHYICESAPVSGHQREMAFLQHLMLYDETDERQELEDKIVQAQGKERSSRRAVWLMVVLTAMAVAGLGYSAILLEDFPQNKTQLLMRIFYALGLASLVSLLAFAGFWLICLGELNEQRERCRRFVTRIVEARLGKPVPVSLPRIVRQRAPRSPVAAQEHKATEGETT
jgi:hypothetical protein